MKDEDLRVDDRCATRCDHDSRCTLPDGHTPADRHETEHGCICYDPHASALNNALSGEADAVRRAESAEMGCEIAYRREPTQAEGDAAEASDAPRGGECFVAMGGWTGRRCRACDRWVWGGPTACEGCVRREERDEARDCGQDTVCKVPPGCQRHWEERNRELAAQLGRLNEFVAKYTGAA